MSSVSRTTSRGGKGAKQEATKTLRNDTKVDSTKSVDHNPKVQPTAEQMRIAQIIDTRSDEPGFKDKIRQVMDATRKTEDEVCTALHDCDNDLDRAVNMLLEGKAQGEWETSVKKKKSRQPVSAPAKPDVAVNSGEQEDWDTEQPGVGVDRERSRTRGGGPPRMRGRGSQDNRSWRGRENKENERNLDEGRGGEGGSGFRRGGGGRMTSGPGRSGRGGRGGGRLGPRTYQSREKQEDSSFPKSIDTWNNPGAEESTSEPLKMEDWDNEEYTGSLADTKVFTPSGGVAETSAVNSEEADTSARSLSTSVASSSGAVQPDMQPQPTQMQSQPWFQSSGVGTLNAAQSEYLSQLTQQASEVGLKSAANSGSGVYKSANTYNNSPAAVAYSTSVAYSTASYPTNNSYMQDADVAAQLPPRAKQRPRVPPPSKIPSSAVEMPGDAINSGGISYLDVQFGGLEFGSETSAFEPPPGLDQQPKYASTGVPTSAMDSMPSARPPSNMDLPAPPSSALDSYSTQQQQQQKTNNQNSIASQINQVQNLSSSGADSILPSSEHKSRETSSYRGGQSMDLDKPDVGLSYSASSAPSYQAYQKSATSYQPNQYSAASYASNAVTSSSNAAYPANASQMSSFSSTGSNYSSAPVAPSNAYQSSAYNASNAYQPTSSYPSISQAPAANTPVSYQGGSQSVYSSLGYSTASSQQYQNNYSGANSSSQQQNHAKMSSTLANTTKEAQYDVTTPTTTNLSGASNGGNASATSATSATKTTSSSAGGKSASAVASLPPGVPPMMGATTHTQYIMGQAGMPYFQQPTPMYSYEDVQIMQQRLPHMPTGYYDMQYQPPTSLATGRDGLASVAYSMSDGRFARTDNNASPVPATLSQQQQTGSQAHSQPMLNASGLPPGYTYYIQGGMVPGGFQYGTPAIYPMAASNAHSSGSSTQYAKPGSYSSGYGSGYDSLTANQDYSKSGYVGNSQSQQSKSGGGGVGSNAGSTASSASDLTATMMYGKSHVALGKVNSYEKQGFHSGTPPPFNLASSQTTPLPPSGGYAPQLFIPTLPPQHHSMHQPQHQMEMRNTTRRSETGGSTNQRQSSTQANKSGQAKQGYNPSYWAPN